jgi:hypothetical protein
MPSPKLENMYMAVIAKALLNVLWSLSDGLGPFLFNFCHFVYFPHMLIWHTKTLHHIWVICTNCDWKYSDKSLTCFAVIITCIVHPVF